MELSASVPYLNIDPDRYRFRENAEGDISLTELTERMPSQTYLDIITQFWLAAGAPKEIAHTFAVVDPKCDLDFSPESSYYANLRFKNK